jgi:hypothetical protein
MTAASPCSSFQSQRNGGPFWRAYGRFRPARREPRETRVPPRACSASSVRRLLGASSDSERVAEAGSLDRGGP